MAIQMKLGKEYNGLGIDLIDAYWRIENVGTKIDDDDKIKIGFNFNCYVNKDSCLKTQNMELVQRLNFGGSVSSHYDGKVYSFFGIYLVDNVFPNGTPNSRNEQLSVLYEFLKTELELENYTNI